MAQFAVLFLLTVIAGLMSTSPLNAAELIQATVLSITDGDTFTAVAGNHSFKVRLACIDAPEKSQKFGARAQLRLSQLIPIGSAIALYAVDQDVYGRVVGVVIGERGNVNLQMVREGYAVVYGQYLDNCPNSRNSLVNAQWEARSKDRIFWSEADPCMPWDFRQGTCSTVAANAQTSLNTSGNSCDSNYSGVCIPVYPPDLDCGDILERNFQSIGHDPHRLDGDHDGIACEF